MKSELKNINITPKKLNVIACLVRGKKAKEALTLLKFVNKKGAKPVYKAIKSAVSNAVHNDKKIEDDLVVSSIYVTKGIVLRRYKAGFKGGPAPYVHIKSHLFVNLN